MKSCRTLIPAALALLMCSPAIGSAADSYTTDGVTIRLVAETPDAEGRLRGAVLFDLEPGWKTYWLDPGETGLAPKLDFSASQSVSPPELAFPAPARLQEGDSMFNGYDEPMAIAFETTVRGVPQPLALSFFVGICREICVPVTAELSRDLAASPSLEDATAIDRAFLALPRVGKAVSARVEGDELVLPATPNEALTGDLFVSGHSGWSFGRAVVEGSAWRVPIRARPDGDDGRPELQAVRVDDDGASRFDIDIR